MSKFDIELNVFIEQLETEIEFESEFRSLVDTDLDELSSDALLPELDFN